jgi:predicted GNAT family N-acyltransferase
MSQLVFGWVETSAELEGAFAVRREVFTHEQGVPPEEEFDEQDNMARHLIVKEGEVFVATARLFFPSSDEARIGRMAILKDYRRKGVGRRMLDMLVREARRQGARVVSLHAQWQVRDFYRACGFIDVGEPFMEAGIKHIAMERKL